MYSRVVCDILADYLSCQAKEINSSELEKFSSSDWDCLLGYSTTFGIAPLIYQAFKNYYIHWQSVPLSVQQKLKRTYLENAATNTRIYQESARVLKAFNDNQIPVIALKGLYLAPEIYRDIALRPMADIDLLVKEDNLLKAGNLLLSLGFKQKIPSWGEMADNSHHLPSFSKESGVVIELHWDIINPERPFQIDLNGIWNRAHPVNLQGIEAMALSLEDLLIYLCLHASFHHRFETTLLPFCDISRVIFLHKKEIDWGQVIRRAQEWYATKAVYLTILLTQKLLNVEAPDSFMEGLKPCDFDPVYLSQLEEEFLIKMSGDSDAFRFHYIGNILRAGSIHEKIFTMIKGAFPSRRVIAYRYRTELYSPKLPFCYLNNLWRLLCNYGRLSFRLLFRDRKMRDSAEKEYKRLALLRWIATG